MSSVLTVEQREQAGSDSYNRFESQEGTFPDACIVTCLTTALKGDKM